MSGYDDVTMDIYPWIFLFSFSCFVLVHLFPCLFFRHPLISLFCLHTDEGHCRTLLPALILLVIMLVCHLVGLLTVPVVSKLRRWKVSR